MFVDVFTVNMYVWLLCMILLQAQVPKIRQSSVRALFLQTCTPNTRCSADTSVLIAVELIHLLHLVGF